MIFPRHRPLAQSFFSFYLKRLIKKHFSAFYVVEDFPREALDGDPILLLPNHSTWWDGFVLFLHNHLELKQTLFLMMLERELRKNPFFSKLGAFSIDPGHPRESLRFSLDILQRGDGRTGLIVFPQGEILPNVVESYRFQPGVSWILGKLTRPVNAVGVQIRILFGPEQFPQIFLGYSFLGKTNIQNGKAQGAFFQEGFIRSQETFDKTLLSGKKGRLFLKGKKSINESHALPDFF